MRKFALEWLLILAGASAFVAWVAFGGVYLRRRFYGVPPIPQAYRTESQFIAILLPRIVSAPQKHAMSSAELADLLGSLQAAGYVSIGMKDVAQFYAQHQRLPPKSVMIAFAQDDPQGIEAADAVLRDLRLRGVAFINQAGASGPNDQRRFLSPHAVSQMRRSGTWDLGWTRKDGTRTLMGTQSFPLRFTGSETGLNDENDDPSALNLLSLRAGRGADENVDIVRNSWPRTAAFYDDFRRAGLGADWIAGWGIISRGNGHLAILPTPRQSGAIVYLRGTEKWRDLTLEFEIKKYQKEFWAYARYKSDGSFVRFGARNGYWYVEQKTGPQSLPSILARAPIQEGVLPARVRLVIKGGFAVVHVNGRMQFGRVLRIAPAIDQGQVVLGVYDSRSRSALAVLTSLSAGPLGEEWISFKRDLAAGFDEESLQDLRDEAVHARAVSPLWVKVAVGGDVSVAETQGEFIRSMAGFYGCRLIPMADLQDVAAWPPERSGRSDKLVGDLADAAGMLDAAGLNLRVRGDQARSPDTLVFLTKLQAVLHLRQRELWVTIDRARGPESALRSVVDGVLEPSDRSTPDLELLEGVRQPPGNPPSAQPWMAAQRQPPMQTASSGRLERP